MSARPYRHERRSISICGGALATVLALGMMLLASCDQDRQPAAPADLSMLRGELIANSEVLLIAGRGAEKASVGLFRFENLGQLDLVVARDQEASAFAMRFRVGERNRKSPFNSRFSTQAPAFHGLPDAEGWVTVEIAGPLEAGVHRLYLSVPEGESMQILEARVARVDDSGAEVELLDSFSDFEGRQRIAGFLDTHLADEMPARAGTLIYGELEHQVQLELTDGGTLRGWLKNLGNTDVVVRAGFAGRDETVELMAGEASELRLSAARGLATLTIAIDNSAAAEPRRPPLVLLGAPGFVPETPLDFDPVVLITLDTTRRDALDPFVQSTSPLVRGTGAQITPHLAAFANGATVFEAAFSVAPWTLPSHSSMLTGLYPFEHGAGVRALELGLEFESAAELLRDHGYETAGFAGGFMSHHKWGVGQGFNQFFDPDGFESSADALSDRVLTFLESVDDDPFMIFVNYFDPHGLYRAPEEFRQAAGVYDRLEALPAESQHFRNLSRGEHEAWRMLLAGEAHGGPAENEYLRAEYDAEVSFMDQQIGRVFDRLKELDLYERSLIVILADHGEMLGELGFYGHGARLDQEQMSIPFMVKFPHQTEPTRVKEVVSSIDVFPTLLSAARIDLGDAAPAARLLTPQGLQGDARAFVLQEEHNNAIHPLFGPMVLAPDVLGVQSVLEQFWSWDSGRLCQSRIEIGQAWSQGPCDSMAWPAEHFALFERESTKDAPDEEQSVSEEEKEALRALGYMNSDE